MKKIFLVLLVGVFSGAHGADDWWGSRRSSPQPATRTQSRSSVGAPPRTLFFTMAPSILAGDGVALPGMNFQVAGRLVREVPLNLTLDAGPFFYTATGFQVAVPILVGMEYEFQITNPRVRPLLGINLGPVVGRRVVFGMLFRPGVNVQIARDVALNFEPRLGVFASSFVFVGQFGVRFAL